MERFPRPVFNGPSMDVIAAIFCLGYICIGGYIGWLLPQALNRSYGWDFGPDWLRHTAQIIGAVGGFYIALRGFVVWVSIAVFGVAIAFFGMVLQWWLG